MPGTEEVTFTCFVCDTVTEGEPEGVLEGDSGRPFCNDCSDGSIRMCAECDEYHDADSEYVYYYGDDMICGDCRARCYFECDNCEQLEHTDNRCVPEDADMYLCEGCYDDLPVCDNCNETVTTTNDMAGDDICNGCGREYAEDLIVEIRNRDYDVDGDEDEDDEDLGNLMNLAQELNLFGINTREWICEDCNERFRGQLPHLDPWDMAHFLALDISRARQCRRCAGVGGPGLTVQGRTRTAYRVRSYSHKPTPEFKRTERDLEKRALHFGTEVELEMFSRNDNRGVALAQLGEQDKEHGLFYCKSDACINNGFEVVSHPFTYDWMTQNRDAFDAMFNLTKSMKGFEATGCGMHIHMSADAFTNLQLFKFMRWFYSNRSYIRSLSRRPKGKLDGWASLKKPEDKKMLSYALDKSKGMGLGRAALNLGSRQTIECRIFRSTLSPTNYYGNIEFLQSLFDYTRNSAVSDTRFEPYMEYVQSRAKSYKNFLILNEVIHPQYEAEGE